MLEPELWLDAQLEVAAAGRKGAVDVTRPCKRCISEPNCTRVAVGSRSDCLDLGSFLSKLIEEFGLIAVG